MARWRSGGQGVPGGQRALCARLVEGSVCQVVREQFVAGAMWGVCAR